MLCLWHINKAVLTYCMPAFTRDKNDPRGQKEWKAFYDSWHEIVASPTEDIYNERLEKFKERYIPGHVNEVGYVTETWLDLYKERFVKAWVNQYLHFEHTTKGTTNVFEMSSARPHPEVESMPLALRTSIAGFYRNLYNNAYNNTHI
ncbi:hypothetical protein ACJ41O_013070 [Fusarium nematophilum]